MEPFSGSQRPDREVDSEVQEDNTASQEMLVTAMGRGEGQTQALAW